MNYPIYHWNLEQQTDEWFSIREKKMTASHAQAIGSCGKGLETYVWEKMAEYYSQGVKESFSNKHTDRGNELEPLARELYEIITGETITECGFIEHSDIIGCSPDGLVMDGEEIKEGIEIKCHDDIKHLKLICNGIKEIESKYIWQIQMNMLITRTKVWKYVAYNPNFGHNSLLIFNVERDESAQEKLQKGFEKGRELMKEIEKSIYKNSSIVYTIYSSYSNKHTMNKSQKTKLYQTCVQVAGTHWGKRAYDAISYYVGAYLSKQDIKELMRLPVLKGVIGYMVAQMQSKTRVGVNNFMDTFYMYAALDEEQLCENIIKEEERSLNILIFLSMIAVLLAGVAIGLILYTVL